MAGGALEYVALITGYRFLLIVVGALYGLAFLTGRLVPGWPGAGASRGAGVRAASAVR
jgi:hypothetical protein